MNLAELELKELFSKKLNEINNIKTKFNLTSLKLIDNSNNNIKVYDYYPLVFLVTGEKALSIIDVNVIAEQLTDALQISVGVYSDKILRSYIGNKISQKDYDLTITHSIDLEHCLQSVKAKHLTTLRL